MVLSDTDVLAKVDGGEIRIAYTFAVENGGAVKEFDPPRRADKGPGRTVFRTRLVRSRLALTLGALVKPVSHARWVRWSQRFAGHSGIVDLRRCADGWALLPGQSAIVFTNERLELGSSLSAFIVGRVSNYNNGLVVTTSYLDSGWQGLIKLHVINTSRRSVRLRLGMDIARLFFDETPGASANTSAVAEQGSHYGSTWSHILSDGADPFPQRPEPRVRGISTALSTTNDFLQRYAGFGALALLLAVGAAGLSLYSNFQDVVVGAREAEELSSVVSEMSRSATLHGWAEIQVGAGESQASIEVPLPKDVGFRSGASAVLAFLEDHSSDATVVGTSTAGADGYVTLTLIYSGLTPASANERVRVLWVYLP